MSLALLAGLAILFTFPILLLLGIPISITIAFSSLLGILTVLSPDVAVLTAGQRIFTGINNFSLLAIPFFILAGNIMNRGGIAERLVNFAKLISGRLPGSLIQTNIIGNMLFGSISGSAVAAAAAIGGTMAELENKEGYNKDLSAAANIASAPTGLLIPPSNSLIIYALVSGGTSVATLFIAGYLPGILWGLSTMIIGLFFAKKYKYTNKTKTNFKQAIKIIIDAIPSLFLIVLIIGGIVGGIFTATEGASVAVVYSFILSFFFYKTIKIKDFYKIVLDSMQLTGIIIFLIGVSSIMSWIMAFTNIPNMISSAMLSISDNKIIILLLMNILLLIIGTFMDLTPAILIFTPIFLPIAKQLGMDPIHFGIMIVFNLCIGNITPPVGNTLFVGCKVGKTKIEGVVKYLLPFYAGIFIVLMLVTYIPDITLIIPKIMGLIK